MRSQRKNRSRMAKIKTTNRPAISPDAGTLVQPVATTLSSGEFQTLIKIISSIHLQISRSTVDILESD